MLFGSGRNLKSQNKTWHLETAAVPAQHLARPPLGKKPFYHFFSWHAFPLVQEEASSLSLCFLARFSSGAPEASSASAHGGLLGTATARAFLASAAVRRDFCSSHVHSA